MQFLHLGRTYVQSPFVFQSKVICCFLTLFFMLTVSSRRVHDRSHPECLCLPFCSNDFGKPERAVPDVSSSSFMTIPLVDGLSTSFEKDGSSIHCCVLIAKNSLRF